MSNMHEIKMRIKSIKETRQITNAMKLISAAKLKRARQQLEQTLPYFSKVETTLADILMHSGEISNIYFDVRNKVESTKKGYLIITGDKGLAGGYNHNIIKTAEAHMQVSPNALLFVAGQIGKDYFLKKNYNVVKSFDFAVQNPTVYRAREISEIILEAFSKGELDEVYLIYTRMFSSVKLEPEVMKLLPLELDALLEDIKHSGYESHELDVTRKPDDSLMYEPSPQAVFDILIPKYLKGVVYGALVEAFASEQTARMTAMDSATANADEMLQKLNLYYNRARQAAITQEISEVVGGAAAALE